MTIAAINARPTRPSDLMERARALVPTLHERAAATEAARMVPSETIAAFREAELLKTLQPAAFGGLGGDFTTMMDLITEVGRGCGSSAWVLGLATVHQWLLSLFPIEAQRDVWADEQQPVISGSYAPSATAQPAPGGYRLTGSWGFVSGVDHASWAMVGVLFPPDPDEQRPSAGFLLVPKSDYAIDDTWHTFGLCGTGSKTIWLDDVFVPAHRRLTFAEASSGRSPGAEVHDDPLYRIPFLAAIPASIASPAFGMVQSALDDFIERVSVRHTRGAVAGGGNRMAEFGTVQMRVAEAAACLDAGRLLLYRDCRDVLDAVRRGEPVSVETRIRNRRDQAFAVRMAVQAVDALQAATGGGGLYVSHATQRAWRDVNAVAKHISLNWDAVATMYGQAALGLEPKGQY